MSSEIIISCLTIGQSPRPDILSELSVLLPENCRLEEMGALDGLSSDQLRGITPAPGEAFYVTLLRDGTEVSIPKHLLEQLVQNNLIEVQRRGGHLAVLLCTGEFPHMPGDIPFLRGGEIIKESVQNLYRGKRIAVIVPDPGQSDHMSQRWKEIGIDHVIYYCLPYHETAQSQQLCAQLKNSDEDFILLDCFGFTTDMAKRFRQQTEKRVLLPRELVGRYLSNYLAFNHGADQAL